jgi:exodeoxyribonuclease VII large subunit
MDELFDLVQPSAAAEDEPLGLPRPWTVRELTKRIRWVLEERFPEVWVRGEISNFRAAPSGHLYFTLKDAEAVLSCVLFREEALRVSFFLGDGQEVTARGRISVYDARGQYQLVVRELLPHGSGSLYQRFETLKKKLRAEGLFDPSRKRRLPVFPERIGLVTSLAGAAIQDFLRILARRAPGILVEIRDVRVQGPTAAGEIAEAIRAFAQEGRVDLLVVARGGGSLEDLWAFNEEEVARALAASPIPTVSAVGHETDFTIADFVADLRAPTPSAAAEMICRDWSEWRELLFHHQKHLEQAALRQVRLLGEKVRRYQFHYVFREPRQAVLRWRQRLDEATAALLREAERGLEGRRLCLERLWERWQRNHPRRATQQMRERLEDWEERLRALGPEATLARGYALVWDQGGRIVREASPALLGRFLAVDLARGRLGVKVEKVVGGDAEARGSGAQKGATTSKEEDPP